MDTKSNFVRLTISEFLKKYRPDGLGHSTIITKNNKGEEKITQTTFEEIICDKCNKDIRKEKYIFDCKIREEGICENCYNNLK